MPELDPAPTSLARAAGALAQRLRAARRGRLRRRRVGPARHAGPGATRQRELIAHAIGPIWEANHVWLILAIVLAFTCFPPVFARIMTVLHIPLSLMLVGIVLRGSAFTFRTYDDEHDAAQRRWGRIFSSASVLTPVLLGVCIGAVASGRVVAPTQGGFAERFVEPWLTPFAFGVGLLTLALFAFLAAVFLTMETRDPELVEDFRRKRARGRRGRVPRRGTGAAALVPAGAAHEPRAGGLALGPAAPPRHRPSRRSRSSPRSGFAASRSRGSLAGPPGVLHLLGMGRCPSTPTWCRPTSRSRARRHRRSRSSSRSGPWPEARWCSRRP